MAAVQPAGPDPMITTFSTCSVAIGIVPCRSRPCFEDVAQSIIRNQARERTRGFLQQIVSFSGFPPLRHRDVKASLKPRESAVAGVTDTRCLTLESAVDSPR